MYIYLVYKIFKATYWVKEFRKPSQSVLVRRDREMVGKRGSGVKNVNARIKCNTNNLRASAIFCFRVLFLLLSFILTFAFLFKSSR